MAEREGELVFRFGPSASAVPMGVFVLWAVVVCLAGAPDAKGLILGAVVGLVAGMFLSRDRWSHYAHELARGMSNPVGVVAILAWLWAGMFAEVLQTGGLVRGLVWLGAAADLTGGWFVGATFLLSALFATAVGTGYGTTVAFVTLMFPAGVLLGAEPVVLLAAVLSGAAFGDNLAPVSDTTIVSATTQGADVPGVVRSRLKYALIAAAPALVLFVLLGGGADVRSARADELLAQHIDPEGLLLLLPFGLVIALALRGHHLLTSLSWGILTAIGLILGARLAAPGAVLSIDAGAGKMAGALVDGVAGYVDMAVLILLIMAAGHLMQVGGAMAGIVGWMKKHAKGSVDRAEGFSWLVVFVMNASITLNTAAEIAAAPFVRDLGSAFRTHPYRRANILDATTSALGYIFPWSGGVLLGYQTLRNLEAKYEFVRVVSPTDVWPWVFHGWLLAAVMLVASLTGFGRTYEGPGGREQREPPAGPPAETP